MIILLFSAEENAILTKIYQDYYPLMKFLAFKLVQDEFSADDMVQDSFIRLTGCLPLLQALGKDELVSYCVRTVETVCISFIRFESRRRRRLEGKRKGRVREFRPEELIEQDEIKNGVGSMLSMLSALDRHLLVYKYFMCYRHRQIGHLLGIEPRYISTYIQRASNRVKRLLRETGNCI